MLAQTQAAEPDLHSKIHRRETSFFPFQARKLSNICKSLLSALLPAFFLLQL
jgi:hypothetical protein